ncbi:hypothetical protein D3C75_973850 [compost metagenome]
MILPTITGATMPLSCPTELIAAVPVAIARPEKVDCGMVQKIGMAMKVPAVASTSAAIIARDESEYRHASR